MRLRTSAAVGGDDRVGQLALSALQIENPFLHRVARDQPVCEDAPVLADAVRAVHGLRLGRRIPPRVEDEHVVGRGQIQPDASRLEADEEQPAGCVGLEPLHTCFAILRPAIEILVRNASLAKLLAQQRQEAGELREDERLVTFVNRLDQPGQQQLQLRRGVAVPFGIDQRRVARRLAQAKQRFEHLQLGGLPRCGAAQQRAPIVIAQLVVERPLPPFQLAENRLLRFRRQIGRDLAPSSASG